MHRYEKVIVTAMFVAASVSQAYAVEIVAPASVQTPSFSALTPLVPVTAEASLSANTGALTPAPTLSANSFTSDVAMAASDFGRLPPAAPSLDGEAESTAAAQATTDAGALPTTGSTAYGMFLLGAGLIFLSGRRRKNDAPWSVTEVQVRA